jgi:polyhydroxyalkanoate synthesis regulator protein
MGNFKHPLTTIKIKLYEKKQDYVEAFELHFSNPQLKKKVFTWLEVTMQVLHDDEITFQEAIQKQSGENAPAYEPLQKLKGSMRKRMVELAQMSCKKTRILISKWFDEGQY